MFQSMFRPKFRIASPNRAEKLQYRAIRRAIESGRCMLTIDPDTFNNKYSPVYNVMENFMPLLVMVILSLVILISTNVIFGVAALLLSVLCHVLCFKPWAEKMLLHRVFTLMLRNYYNFQYLWMLGGITLTLASKPDIGCRAPGGDWKSFTSLNFADLMTLHFLPKAPPLPALPVKPEPRREEAAYEEEGPSVENEDDIFNFDDLDLR